MARSGADAIREQVRQRYGIDVDAVGPGAGGVASLSEAARAKTQAQEYARQLRVKTSKSPNFSQKPNGKTKPAARPSSQKTHGPSSWQDKAATTYDSAGRREALAKSLDHIGDREAV